MYSNIKRAAVAQIYGHVADTFTLSYTGVSYISLKMRPRDQGNGHVYSFVMTIQTSILHTKNY